MLGKDTEPLTYLSVQFPTSNQGWARDVKARDRDETETLASPAETRPRRDVCSSRDVTETLKYKFY